MLCKTRDCGLDSAILNKKVFGLGLMEERQTGRMRFGFQGNRIILAMLRIAEKLDGETIINQMMQHVLHHFLVYVKKDCNNKLQSNFMTSNISWI